MKKVLTFLAVAIVAAASQAATVQWKSGAMMEAKDATGAWGTDKAKGSVTAVYLIVNQATYNYYVGSNGKIDQATKGLELYNNIGTVANIRKSSAITSNNGGQANWSDATEIAKTDGTVYALALYTYSHATYGDFYIAGAGTVALNDVNEPEGNFTGLAAGVGNWTAAPVPEPTTVALLALGLAAVGLKRKLA